MSVLSTQEAQERRSGHEQRVDAWTLPHLERRHRGEAHAVWDFLFDYYRTSPAKLREWHPGAGVVVPQELAPRGAYVRVGDGATADLSRVPTQRVRQARGLLRATLGRPAQLGCFGLHEWAMVYRAPELRHPLPLRLGRAGTDAVVEAAPLRCTHFDAWRFFTPEAAALAPALSRERQVDDEQPGCLHAGMDLYRWSAGLVPWVPSELVADCFDLARRIRLLDMRASPYDLSAYGHSPVAVETPAGRADYAAQQRAFSVEGQVLRGRLLSVLDELVAARPQTAST